MAKEKTKDAPKDEPVKAPTDLTPAQWAPLTEHTMTIKRLNGKREKRPDAEHAAADALHGWSVHVYHDKKNPLMVKKDDYLKAIEAAKRPPEGERSYEPHPAALSKHAPYARRKAAEKEG